MAYLEWTSALVFVFFATLVLAALTAPRRRSKETEHIDPYDAMYLQEEIVERLHMHGIHTVDVKIKTEIGEIRLTGKVKDLATRELVEEVAESVPHHYEVVSLLEVERIEAA